MIRIAVYDGFSMFNDDVDSGSPGQRWLMPRIHGFQGLTKKRPAKTKTITLEESELQIRAVRLGLLSGIDVSKVF